MAFGDVCEHEFGATAEQTVKCEPENCALLDSNSLSRDSLSRFANISS